jgi:hypothetical protein
MTIYCCYCDIAIYWQHNNIDLGCVATILTVDNLVIIAIIAIILQFWIVTGYVTEEVFTI